MGSKYDSDSDLCVLRLGPAATEAADEEFQRRQQNNNHHHHQNQQLSIFYGGRVSVCDVTEIQAMEIINAAKRKTEEEEERRRRREEEEEERMTGMSMKRSLQRFLQKRKTRSEVTKSPYFHPRTHTSSPST